MQAMTTKTNRSGFTLIELLVVMSIMVFLLGLGVLIVPVFRSSGATIGADQLQGWLHIARQRALRDQGPRGLRLIVEQFAANTPNHLVARTAQYIETPTDFTGGTVQTSGRSNQATFTNIALDGGLGQGQEAFWPVQPGDFIQVRGTTHRILTVTRSQIAVVPNFTTTTRTSSYKIIRSPRPVAGEETLKFPQGVLIDLSGNPQGSRSFYQAAQGRPQFVDILFAPSGEVLSQGSGGKAIFWVREPDEPITADEQSLITVYIRTGVIARHPVNVENRNDLFRFTRDLRATGL